MRLPRDCTLIKLTRPLRGGRHGRPPAAAHVARFFPTLTDADATSVTAWWGDRGSPWIWWQDFATLFNAEPPPTAAVPEMFSHYRGWHAARSNHPRGVNARFRDGYAQFIKDSATLATYHGMRTHNGGEVPSADSFWRGRR